MDVHLRKPLLSFLPEGVMMRFAKMNFCTQRSWCLAPSFLPVKMHTQDYKICTQEQVIGKLLLYLEITRFFVASNAYCRSLGNRPHLCSCLRLGYCNALVSGLPWETVNWSARLPVSIWSWWIRSYDTNPPSINFRLRNCFQARFGMLVLISEALGSLESEFFKTHLIPDEPTWGFQFISGAFLYHPLPDANQMLKITVVFPLGFPEQGSP